MAATIVSDEKKIGQYQRRKRKKAREERKGEKISARRRYRTTNRLFNRSIVLAFAIPVRFFFFFFFSFSLLSV